MITIHPHIVYAKLKKNFAQMYFIIQVKQAKLLNESLIAEHSSE